MLIADHLRFAFVVLVGAAACVPPSSTAPQDVAFDDLRRVVAALDDVAGEYPFAVARGQVVDATRARVIAQMLREAESYAARFPKDERRALADVGRRTRARAEPAEVTELARRLRRKLVERYQLSLAPAAPPDRARAEWFWAHLCAGCHGDVGMGDGEQGVPLDPPPKDFLDPDFMAGLSPSRAFSQISDGVIGTAMPRWGLFTTSERWGLAFLVFGFQHDPDAITRGREIVLREGLPSSSSVTADRTNRQLLEDLIDGGLRSEDASDVLAYLRADAPFNAPTGRLASVRASLGALASGYRVRSAESYERLAAARAAIGGEMILIRSTDPVTAARLEDELSALEAGLDAAQPEELIARGVVRLGPLLDRAERELRAPSWSGAIRVAFETAFAPALLVGLLLARARPRTPVVRRGVAGVAVGLAVGALGSAGTQAIFALVMAGIAIVSVARSGRSAEALRPFSCGGLLALPLAQVARAFHGAFGIDGAAPVLVAASLVVIAATATSLAARADRTRSILALALAVATAGAVGRSAWLLSPSATLAIPRVEALGIEPSVPALVAAAGTFVAALVAVRKMPAAVTSGG